DPQQIDDYVFRALFVLCSLPRVYPLFPYTTLFRSKIFNRRNAPQSQPIPGSNQVRNSGGGYSWQADDWTRFDRFLILGAEGGTYYITERDLVKQNHDAIVRCVKADGIRAVNRIVEISDSGRAPK